MGFSASQISNPQPTQKMMTPNMPTPQMGQNKMMMPQNPMFDNANNFN